MSIALGKSNRNPLALGWEAARANAVPAFILQAAMVALLVAYYVSPAAAAALNRLAEYKQKHGLAFVIVAAIAAGALLPELFVICFFQKGRPRMQNLRNLAFTIPTWGIDGILVDLMYRGMATGFGDVVKANYYVLDMSNITVLREVRRGYLGPAAPASTLVEVRKLANEEFLVEIEMIAVCAK